MERVERDADRQQDLEQGRADIEPEVVKELRPFAGEEVPVLEEPEDPEVHDEAAGEDLLAPSLGIGDLEQPPDRVVGPRRDHEEPEEPPVERAIEQVRSDEKEHVLAAATEPPVDDQNDGEKRCVLQGVEGHGIVAAGSASSRNHPRRSRKVATVTPASSTR
jgi:hypothetical protein